MGVGRERRAIDLIFDDGEADPVGVTQPDQDETEADAPEPEPAGHTRPAQPARPARHSSEQSRG